MFGLEVGFKFGYGCVKGFTTTENVKDFKRLFVTVTINSPIEFDVRSYIPTRCNLANEHITEGRRSNAPCWGKIKDFRLFPAPY